MYSRFHFGLKLPSSAQGIPINIINILLISSFFPGSWGYNMEISRIKSQYYKNKVGVFPLCVILEDKYYIFSSVFVC